VREWQTALQEVPERQRPARGFGLRPGTPVTATGSADSPCPGNGASRAMTKTATIPAIISRFGMEMRMKFQFT
jgi:hypothetical protein